MQKIIYLNANFGLVFVYTVFQVFTGRKSMSNRSFCAATFVVVVSLILAGPAFAAHRSPVAPHPVPQMSPVAPHPVPQMSPVAPHPVPQFGTTVAAMSPVAPHPVPQMSPVAPHPVPQMSPVAPHPVPQFRG